MRFDSVLIELSATPTYLFLIFAILLIVFHVVLVWLVPLADLGGSRSITYGSALPRWGCWRRARKLGASCRART